MYTPEEIQRGKTIVRFISIIIASMTAITIILMTVIPWYKIWSKKMEARAAFVEAVTNKNILMIQAKANLEAQRLNSQAEVERAIGMAKAMEIEDDKLTREYIYYLWVRNIDKIQGQKIYIPTESQLPILERESNGQNN